MGHPHHLQWYLDEERIGPQSQGLPQHDAEKIEGKVVIPCLDTGPASAEL